MSIATELMKLGALRVTLADNLNAKGVTASGTETLTELVAKVLDITQSGGGGDGFAYGWNLLDYDQITATSIDKP